MFCHWYRWFNVLLRFPWRAMAVNATSLTTVVKRGTLEGSDFGRCVEDHIVVGEEWVILLTMATYYSHTKVMTDSTCNQVHADELISFSVHKRTCHHESGGDSLGKKDHDNSPGNKGNLLVGRRTGSPRFARIGPEIGGDTCTYTCVTPFVDCDSDCVSSMAYISCSGECCYM